MTTTDTSRINIQDIATDEREAILWADGDYEIDGQFWADIVPSLLDRGLIQPETNGFYSLTWNGYSVRKALIHNM